MHNYCEPDQQDLIADYNHTKGVVRSPPTTLRFLFILHLSISAPVASRLVATEDSLSVPDATPPMTFIVHCHPQTVSKLPAESKERDRVRLSNEELCFIPWQLPHGVNWVSLTAEPLSSGQHCIHCTQIARGAIAHWIQAARGANSTRWHPPPPWTWHQLDSEIIPLNIPPTLAPDTNIFNLSITPSPPPRSS